MKDFYRIVSSEALVMDEDGKCVELSDVYREFADDCDEGTEYNLEYNGLPLVLKGLEQYGGEDLGSSWWIVFSVTYNNETTIYKLDGWYASYHGHEFSDYKPYEVSQQPVTKMEWVKV